MSALRYVDAVHRMPAATCRALAPSGTIEKKMPPTKVTDSAALICNAALTIPAASPAHRAFHAIDVQAHQGRMGDALPDANQEERQGSQEGLANNANAATQTSPTISTPIPTDAVRKPSCRETFAPPSAPKSSPTPRGRPARLAVSAWCSSPAC